MLLCRVPVRHYGYGFRSAGVAVHGLSEFGEKIDDEERDEEGSEGGEMAYALPASSAVIEPQMERQQIEQPGDERPGLLGVP